MSKIEALNSRLHKRTRKILFSRQDSLSEEFKAVCECAAKAFDRPPANGKFNTFFTLRVNIVEYFKLL